MIKHVQIDVGQLACYKPSFLQELFDNDCQMVPLIICSFCESRVDAYCEMTCQHIQQAGWISIILFCHVATKERNVLSSNCKYNGGQHDVLFESDGKDHEDCLLFACNFTVYAFVFFKTYNFLALLTEINKTLWADAMKARNSVQEAYSEWVATINKRNMFQQTQQNNSLIVSSVCVQTETFSN